MHFKTHLEEASQPGKNLHLEHIEEEILNFGVEGGRGAINFLRSLRDMLAGHAESKVSVSVKWDGAPAVWAGVDPADGKFFVSTKGAFNKTPKLAKTEEDLNNFSPGLRPKLKIALSLFPKLNIPKGVVLQGDMMYTQSDLSVEDVDGEKHVIFQPNTIAYAVPLSSDFGKRIKKSKIGVVWHTTYTGGPTLADMSASFGADVSKLRRTPDVWFDDATYKDLSGRVKFTASETKEVTKHLSQAGKVFQRIPGPKLRKFLDFQNSLSGSVAGASFKTFTNSKIREGKGLHNPALHVKEYQKYFKDYWNTKVIAKVKQEATKRQKERLLKEHLRAIIDNQKTLQQVIEFEIHIIAAKNLIVQKLNSGADRLTRTFIKTADGYKVTDPEGFVAIDHLGKKAVKLVSRLEFSKHNFTATKNWSK